MGVERQGELSRIVALRGCGHVAAFRSFAELLREKHRCPICVERHPKAEGECKRSSTPPKPPSD